MGVVEDATGSDGTDEPDGVTAPGAVYVVVNSLSIDDMIIGVDGRIESVTLGDDVVYEVV